MVARKNTEKTQPQPDSANQHPKYVFTNHHFYYEIACRAMRENENLKTKMAEIKPSQKERFHRLGILRHEQEMAFVTAIVFSAMSLEAFMYSYGCHRIVSKTFFDKSLDKLDLMAKFLIFPKLIAGNSPPKEGKGTAYPLIEKLVKSRNDLVHYKQTEMSLNEAVEKGKAMELDARNAITAVRLAIAQLSAIDNNISENEIRFLDDAAAGNGIPDELIEHELPSIDPELDD